MIMVGLPRRWQTNAQHARGSLGIVPFKPRLEPSTRRAATGMVAAYQGKAAGPSSLGGAAQAADSIDKPSFLTRHRRALASGRVDRITVAAAAVSIEKP